MAILGRLYPIGFAFGTRQRRSLAPKGEASLQRGVSI
jgi:hypothetical protein